MTAFEAVIGLEVHAQLKTKSKLFCACSTTFGQTPNTQVCPVCLGLPGALPVLNKGAVDLAIRAALALNSAIQSVSVFARKNYFYPDLPKGYQISQFDKPLATGGYLDVFSQGQTRRIQLTRIHMEEDAGKLIHQGAVAITGSTHSISDLNRACTPLIEIVSEPDLRSAEEARLYMESLKEILQFLGICDGQLEEGSLRADANVSLRPVGSQVLGTKTEVKNLNSFRSVERAILSEIQRQTKLLDSGERVIQQTRHYDDASQTTRALRSKEEAHDYRYFPEPDLLPLHISDDWIASIQKNLAELPGEKRTRYQETLGLSVHEATVLTGDPSIAAYFEASLEHSPPHAKLLAKWIIGDLMSLGKEHGVSPEHLADLVTLIASDKLSGTMAKSVLSDMAKSGESATDIVKKTGISQVTDTDALTVIVQSVLDQNLDVLQKIQSGKANSAEFLVGQVMKQTKGQAKPEVVRELLRKVISEATSA